MVDVDKLMPTNDVLFKKVLGNRYKTEGLIDFLNAVLKPKNPIVSVQILNGELTKQHVLDKGSRLDILATTNTGEIVNIECQASADPNFLARLLRYWGQNFVQQIREGDKYSSMKRTISIAVLTFNLPRNDNRYKKAASLCDLETHQRWTDLIELHVLQLPNLEHIDDSDRTTYWMQFFKDPYSDEAKKVYEKVPVIKEAMTMFEEAKSNDEVLELIRMREEAAIAVASQVAEAEDKVRAEERAKADAEKRESAKSLLTAGVDTGVIAKSLGLSVDEINEIKKKIQ